MREIVSDAGLVARCGLYCGACGSYLRGKCPGCAENVKAKWCRVRSCCIGQIRRLGVRGHADEMARSRRQTIKR